MSTPQGVHQLRALSPSMHAALAGPAAWLPAACTAAGGWWGSCPRPRGRGALSAMDVLLPVDAACGSTSSRESRAAPRQRGMVTARVMPPAHRQPPRHHLHSRRREHPPASLATRCNNPAVASAVSKGRETCVHWAGPRSTALKMPRPLPPSPHAPNAPAVPRGLAAPGAAPMAAAWHLRSLPIQRRTEAAGHFSCQCSGAWLDSPQMRLLRPASAQHRKRHCSRNVLPTLAFSLFAWLAVPVPPYPCSVSPTARQGGGKEAAFSGGSKAPRSAAIPRPTRHQRNFI